MTFTLLGMAAKLAAVAIETEVAIGVVLDEASALGTLALAHLFAIHLGTISPNSR